MEQQNNSSCKREHMAASRMEVDILRYSLQEAFEKLEKKQAELDRVAEILERTEEVSDQRARKLAKLTALAGRLSRRLARWQALAVIEAVIMVIYIILQGVG